MVGRAATAPHVQSGLAAAPPSETLGFAHAAHASAIVAAVLPACGRSDDLRNGAAIATTALTLAALNIHLRTLDSAPSAHVAATVAAAFPLAALGSHPQMIGLADAVDTDSIGTAARPLSELRNPGLAPAAHGTAMAMTVTPLPVGG